MFPLFPLDLSTIFLIGGILFALGIINGVRNLFNNWAKAAGAPVKPLSITLKTDKTPQEVVDAAQAARRARAMFIALVAVAGYLLARYQWPEPVDSVSLSLLEFAVVVLRQFAIVLMNIAEQLGQLLQSQVGI